MEQKRNVFVGDGRLVRFWRHQDRELKRKNGMKTVHTRRSYKHINGTVGIDGE